MGSTLSVVASVAILRSSFNDLVPPEIRSYIWEISRRFSSEFTMVIKESHEGSTNHLFNALATYLGSNAFSTTSSAPLRVTVGKNESMKVLTYGLDRNSEIVDVFHGVQMKWAYYTDFNSALHYEMRWYELRFHKKHTDMVKNNYLPYILDMAKRIKDQNRMVKFYTTRGGRDGWSSKGMNLDHPMTFETLAMDGDLKQRVIDDLDGFISTKDYYKKIGKVWKRGYLLYGPPGTGKSSLIAAMANYLNFDIYNLNLSAVNSDSSLEYLLLHMSNRSILVIEDIDCSIVLHNRESGDAHRDHIQTARPPQVTLSGLLNAIDGLMSCCGDERIVVFTTNYKERIDPALLRAGRMDMHIYLSYCTFSTFKQLVANYLEVLDHALFGHIEKLITEVQVSPAEVAGELMKTKDTKICLEGLIKFLEIKRLEAKSSPPPPSELQGDETRPETDGNDGLNKENEHQVQSSCETTNFADDAYANENEDNSTAIGSTSTEVNGYIVKAELEPILNAILSKHGDIAAKCSLQSVLCRSALLVIVCGIIQMLQARQLESITKLELKSMISSICDLESVRIEVGWLHQRLDEIIQAMPLIEHYGCSMKEEKNRNITKPEESEIIPSTLAKLHCFYHKSLVEGLL